MGESLQHSTDPLADTLQLVEEVIGSDQLRTSTQPFTFQNRCCGGREWHMPLIVDSWFCMNACCRNRGKICWRARDPDARNTAAGHYPVPGELLRGWNKEIRDEKSTVEQPSPTLILALGGFRNKEWKGRMTKAEPQAKNSMDRLLQTYHGQPIGPLEQPDCLSKHSLTNLFSIKPYPYLNQNP